MPKGGSVKGSDNVFVHPRWRTVHEVRANGALCCGNPLNKIDYVSMTRQQAQGDPHARPCHSLACEAARRDN
jgi:hypothetical protein